VTAIHCDEASVSLLSGMCNGRTMRRAAPRGSLGDCGRGGGGLYSEELAWWIHLFPATDVPYTTGRYTTTD